MASVVYITRAACTCVTCFVALPAGTWTCAVAAGMSCLRCARVDGNAPGIVVMTWNQRRARFEPRRSVVRRPVRPSPRKGPFVDAFAAHIRAAFPAMPSDLESAIAEHACAKGRIGNTRLAKSLDARAIILAVVAHVRHRETPYDAMLANGTQLGPARKAIQPRINEVLARWRGL